MKIKIAIDSGWKGAIACEFKNQSWTINCADNFVDMFHELKELKFFADNEGCKIDCVMESVGPMPSQSCKSTWRQAENYFGWQMALISLGIPFSLVTPQKWMKVFGNVPKGKDNKKKRKDFFVDRMKKLYPNIKVTLKNADALAMLSIFDKL